MDFDVFLERWRDMAKALLDLPPGGDVGEAHREAMMCALAGLLGGAAPNSRPGQLLALTATKDGSARAPWPCIFGGCTLGGACAGNTLRVRDTGAVDLCFIHHKNRRASEGAPIEHTVAVR